MGQSVAAYLHYFSVLALFALLVAEYVLFSKPLDLSRARRLIITDLSYGVVAGLVLMTGLARVIWYGKGLSYYLHNSLFLTKVGLFLVVGLISALPTFVFINWRNDLKAGRVPLLEPRMALAVKWVIRVELLVLLFIPVLAALMARGYGMFS
ncbi:DUF2214 family protein [Pseudomonas sp. TTU2014-080ASC]|jgi:putative membrane protein|uniref:DUF2214 family protein n=1 Tax=Pseudomonas sp. TTU2014-080ASC TaxID=1729724 RepID=UPI00071850CE|nr:DUF2214 family protein [Pseudomonas sp. TTU2014-080ASC]KRW57824.1 hypothetical protein AO726_19395 [Pseudomonas sp. TTU2014-080ASC]